VVIPIKKMGTILGLLLTMAALVVLPIKFDTRYAKAGDLEQVRKNMQQLHSRLDQKIEMDKANQFNMWMIQMVIEFGDDKSKWSTSARERYEMMKGERDRIRTKYGEGE